MTPLGVHRRSRTVDAGPVVAVSVLAPGRSVPVATTLDGDPIGDAPTRFVAPGLDSARCLRDLAVIEPVTLPPGTDRTEYESTGE